MTLTDLFARVEAATGPDRELDGALWRKLIFDPQLARPGNDWTLTPNLGRKKPRYTASIDAALALAERVLPGWAWMLRGSFAKLWEPHGKPPGNDFDAMGRSPALAIIAAILKALIAAETKVTT